MTNKGKQTAEACCESDQIPESTVCCQVDALISIDGRGQIVLPKDVREKAGVKAGDKFVVISYASGGKICGIFLVKADEFSETVRGMLGPMMKEIMQ